MLEPVAPDTFYDTVPGQQLLTILASKQRATPRTLSLLYEIPDNTGEVADVDESAIPGYSSQRLRKIAGFLNANYDPDTNRCTLYRAVSPGLAQDFEDHGAITSRLVKSFGDYDPDLAIESLERATRGDILGHVKSAIESTFADLEERIARLDSSKPDWAYHVEHFAKMRKKTEALALGKPSKATVSILKKKLSLLRRTRHLGREAYLTIVHEVGDNEADPFPGSIGALTHSTIHLTSDMGFIDSLRNSWDSEYYSWLLRVNFAPGRLAVGTSVGYIDGSYVKAKYMPDSEYEWYGVGQLAVHPNEVEITTSRL